MKLVPILAVVLAVAVALIWKVNIFNGAEPAGIVWCRGCIWPPN